MRAWLLLAAALAGWLLWPNPAWGLLAAPVMVRCFCCGQICSVCNPDWAGAGLQVDVVGIQNISGTCTCTDHNGTWVLDPFGTHTGDTCTFRFEFDPPLCWDDSPVVETIHITAAVTLLIDYLLIVELFGSVVEVRWRKNYGGAAPDCASWLAEVVPFISNVSPGSCNSDGSDVEVTAL